MLSKRLIKKANDFENIKKIELEIHNRTADPVEVASDPVVTPELLRFLIQKYPSNFADILPAVCENNILLLEHPDEAAECVMEFLSYWPTKAATALINLLQDQIFKNKYRALVAFMIDQMHEAKTPCSVFNNNNMIPANSMEVIYQNHALFVASLKKHNNAVYWLGPLIDYCYLNKLPLPFSYDAELFSDLIKVANTRFKTILKILLEDIEDDNKDKIFEILKNNSKMFLITDCDDEIFEKLYHYPEIAKLANKRNGFDEKFYNYCKRNKLKITHDKFGDIFKNIE